MYISDITGTGGSFTPYEASLQSVVKAANARGGADGHQINLIVCDSEANANAGAACGQQAVTDKVIAVIAYNTVGTEMPYLQAAKIPDFNIGITPDSYKDSVSFIVDNLALVASFGTVGALANIGCKDFATIDPELGSAQLQATAQGAVALAAQKFHMVNKGLITVPQTAPDTSSYISQVAHTGANCLVEGLMGTQSLNALAALENVPSVTKIGVSSDYLHQAGVAAAVAPIAAKLGSRLVAILPAEQPTAASTNPAVKQWIADEASYTTNTAVLGSVDAVQWAELQLIIKAADAVGSAPTGAKLISYLNTLSNYAPGVVPPVNFTKAVPNLLGPRVFTSWAAPGKFTPPANITRTGPFVSLLTGQANSNGGP